MAKGKKVKSSIKEEKKPELKADENKTDGKGKELYWIIGIMAICLLIIILVPYISKELNTFKYQSLTFTKEKFGEISVYHYYYSFSYNGENYQYNLFLRNDPRKNNVRVSGEITYPSPSETIYVSINGEEMMKCKNSLRDIYSLAGFMQDNMFKVKSGYPDEEFAEKNNLTYVDCGTHPDSMVIVIKEGNETKIENQGNCYTINIADCQILDAIEKFEVQSVIDAKKRAKTSNL